MKLVTLKLRNFMGIKNFELDAKGSNVSIYGANGAGKTTLFSAFLWLLFNKDATNRTDFDIKTLDKEGQVIHGLEHQVEAVLEIGGKELALCKIYKEQWTRKRGSVSREFTGHTTDHFIDGVPVPKKDFTARISEISAEDVFKLLTNPTYFNTQLHWQERRKILLEICGDITDAEVIASEKALSKLPDILNGRKLDDHRKVINERRKAVNDKLEKIPVRIDETERGLPDISNIQVDKLPEDIAKLRAKVREKNQEILRIEGGGESAEKTKQLRTIEGEILRLRNERQQRLDALAGKKREDLRLVKGAVLDLKGEIGTLTRTISSYENDIATYTTKMEQLRQDWHNENERKFNFEQEEICPTCGQDLPHEQLQDAREKALATFNKHKADKLETINADGQKLKALKNKMEIELNKAQANMQKATADIEQLQKKEASLLTEADAILQGAKTVEESTLYASLLEQKASLEEEIKELEVGNCDSITSVREGIYVLENAIAALESATAQVDSHKRGLERIKELKQEEKKLAAEYEQLENELYLTEQFICAKVSLLEEKINSKFELARFKLFNVLVNGAVEECCETIYNGVPYSSGLNNAARINVGLDIINTLADHYSIDAPIFVDNAEAVTELIETRGQQIRLVVSADDKKLRVEVAEVPQTLFSEREAV